MPKAGDVVLVDFVGATGVKRRAAVVVSSETYHAHRPDIICVSLTGVTGARNQISDMLAPTLRRIREHTDKPVALGFGVQTRIRQGKWQAWQMAS